MWIVDSVSRGGIDLWCKEGSVRVTHHEYDPPFYLYLPDPDAYHEMTTALEEEFRAEPCTFQTIFGEHEGYKVFAGRDVAEAIERQTRYAAQLFNVDIRKDQRFMAERGILPCCDGMETRFSPEITHDMDQMEIRIQGNPNRDCAFTEIEIVHGRTERLTGTGRAVLSDLFGFVDACDPDVLLMPNADRWMPIVLERARDWGIPMTLSRNGKYRTISSRSYWSYGRVEHKDAAIIPDGRILIDTEQSFVYREGGSRACSLRPGFRAGRSPATPTRPSAMPPSRRRRPRGRRSSTPGRTRRIPIPSRSPPAARPCSTPRPCTAAS